MTDKYVYLFSEGKGDMKDLLGGKGANLAEMTRIGLNVPPGFIVTTEACNQYRKGEKTLPKGLMTQVKKAMKEIEKQTGKGFGDPKKPLLVSVRSGAKFSMPGMMDTILNLGLNSETLEGLAKMYKDKRLALDCYRRLIQMFGDVVLNVSIELFEHQLEVKKKEKKVKLDTQLKEKDLQELVDSYLAIIKEQTGKAFPSDPETQLEMAMSAVFDSWDNPRANTYRQLNDIPDDIGTAVNIQTMVFGNVTGLSGTGVGFTRNPSTGFKEYYGDYLMNAQGEDVVAGIRTPKMITEMEQDMPEQFEELRAVYPKLEAHYKDMQDFEFTIESGTLYILQTRNGKRSAQAAIKIAVDMVDERLITKKEAILKIDPNQIAHLLHRRLDSKEAVRPIANGLPASPGAAVGKAVFTADDAVKWHARGEKVILVRKETKPDDIHGFVASEGILTARGGKTSHAAVVARGMGKPCVSGCEDMLIDEIGKSFKIGGVTIFEGDIITIDGMEGHVIQGAVKTIAPDLSEEAERLLKWADDIRHLGVWANASTPEEAMQAKKFGAEGVGLCRTERMFNDPDRLPIMLEMILAETNEARQDALDRLLPFQRKDFIDIFKIMEEKPVVIRLLDIPLHEFLPSVEELNRDVTELQNFVEWLKSMRSISGAVDMIPVPEDTKSFIHKLSKETEIMHDQEVAQKVLAMKFSMLAKVRKLVEVNPMLGHRGVRLGISYPEIYRMQMRAVCEAAAHLIKEGQKIEPQIMIPQVCTSDELKWAHQQIIQEQAAVEKEQGIKIPVVLGTMIEVVRACMRAGRIAQHAKFFSFGTNDLTQAVFSFSREDAENTFLPLYNERKILRHNPFEILDQKGVGRLMAITVQWGRKTNPNLKIGICGEHGGEPKSIGFVHTIGLDYVSCSPFRVPVARFAAAQAALKKPEDLNVIWGTY
ncbi:MAG: pyruvate, phosphate dikinase [Thermoplasmata archaeon]|nr:pyruvate, phosphate dikinase [Thermoplasmata archaeon]